MKNSINLAIKKDQNAEKAINRFRGLRITAFLALFAVFIATGVLLILIAFSPLKDLRQTQQNELNKLAQFHPKMAKVILTNERIAAIKDIIQKRSALDKRLDWMTQVVPSSLQIQSYAINNKKVALVLSSSSLDVFQQTLTHLTALADSHDTVKSVLLDTTSYNGDKGTYNISLTLELL